MGPWEEHTRREVGCAGGSLRWNEYASMSSTKELRRSGRKRRCRLANQAKECGHGPGQDPGECFPGSD